MSQSLSQYPSKVKVGSYNESQLRAKQDKSEVELAKTKTGFQYVITRLVKRKGEQLMDVYLISNEDYLNSTEF